MIEELIKLANFLDEQGRTAEADKVDAMVQKMAAEFGEPFSDKMKEMPKCPECANPREPNKACEFCGTGAEPAELEAMIKKLEEAGFKVMKADVNANDVLSKLADIADKLDTAGLKEEASLVDEFIKKTADDVMKWKEEDKKTEQSKRYDSKYHHSLQIREPKKDQERVDREGRKNHHVSTYQQTNAVALSTRHCPDHIGYALGRIGESTYQCSLDGQVYNWEAGWTDYQGTKHPGGSVAGQTPDSSGYAIPHRIFDSRENTLNRVN